MSTDRKVRVRFAPSPTGGLHLGGVRTALFNYLFAKQQHGDFVLRIEDTDQSRFVAGAEEYIIDCLRWCGIEPDEGPHKPGNYGPYRQSERKASYRQFAEQLVADGHAYYAFDTPEALESMRVDFKTDQNPSPQYDHRLRMRMRNSLTLAPDEVQSLLQAGTPHVIRIKVPENETVHFVDMIRGDVSFNTNTVDDKVLLKADGMPTYHLAVVVDDHAMQITHAFRGEEWLPSAPVHLLLWKYLGWQDEMPEWAHFPLILKPDGNGKLSKRDGDRLGFPVFAMDWKDPKTGETNQGFKERGFLSQAFVNMLAVLGWNDGTEQEIFSLDDLVTAFSIDRIHKGGAKFDFEKAKWFNHEWIKRMSNDDFIHAIQPFIPEAAHNVSADMLHKVAALMKDRCVFLSDFKEQTGFFFTAPQNPDLSAIKPKWNNDKQVFFSEWLRQLHFQPVWKAHDLELTFKEMAAAAGIKAGDLLLPLRVMLVGGKSGPGVFDIIELLGIDDTTARVKHTLSILQS
jgi:glutamyl-tRNA synthetase